MIKVLFCKDLNGDPYYDLIGLDTYESFDQVIVEIIKLEIPLTNQVDGFYHRVALFELQEKKFKIIYHEDVGVYAESISDSKDDEWLRRILDDVVVKLNKLNQT